MSAQTQSDSAQRGFAHILILFVIVLLIVVSVLIFLGFQASKALNLSSPQQQAQYQNPFDQEVTYENPFDDYQNPFDQVTQ